MEEKRRFRYTLLKDGVELKPGSDCVHTAKSRAERVGAQLWRNLPDRSYMVTDYGKGSGDEAASSLDG